MATFTIVPDQENPVDIVCYSRSTGLKLCNAATKELPMKFDYDSKNLIMFCDNQHVRQVKVD